jgi:Uma2 family endonuclease
MTMLPTHAPPRPPNAADLPVEDGEPMETAKHRKQMNLLIDSIELAWQGRDFFVGGNMFFYYSELQSRKNDFRGPDFFLVLNTSHHDRDAWVVWAEDGRTPDVVIELVSKSTAAHDLGPKKAVYARLKVADYFVFDPETGDLHSFRLDHGGTYRSVLPLASGRTPCGETGLELGLHNVVYQAIEGPWLRWFTPEGVMLPIAEEIVHAERARADRESEQAKQERARADRESEQAKQERARADRESEQAKQERARAERAERRAAELEERLRKLGD